MTAKELKEALANVPDDAEVYLCEMLNEKNQEQENT
jgi:hypothetical protein